MKRRLACSIGKSVAPMKLLPKTHAEAPRYPKGQRGVSLIIALIALVALTLAGIAMVRSVDTGNMIAGNLAFKNNATSAGDIGTETAITWLQTRAGTATSYTDQPTAGYYATSQDTLDMTGSSGDPNRAFVDWDSNSCNNATSVCITPSPSVSDGAGNSVRYVIHRLCASTGDPNATTNSCANYLSGDTDDPGTGDPTHSNPGEFTLPPAEYYRITSRVQGPRNTVSFVETIVHF